MDNDNKQVLKDMIDAIINKKDGDVEAHFHNYLQTKSQKLINDQQKTADDKK